MNAGSWQTLVPPLSSEARTNPDALHQYLYDTDELVGKLYALCETTHYLWKVEKAKVYAAEFGQVDERKATAEKDPAVLAKWEDHDNAIADWKTLDARRKTCQLGIDMWRTNEASHRRM